MAILSRSLLNSQLLTVQCDICRPAWIATTTTAELAAAGWQMAAEGSTRDTCPACVRVHRRDAEEWRAGWRSPEPTPGGRLPNVVVIGAAKCGTTSMHEYLDSHPDIFMARIKELRFFADPDHREWLGHYMAQFESSALVVGESSPVYSRAPAVPGAAERMAKLIPDARLIFMVRDPVDRALASYQEERFQGLDTRPFEEAFGDLDDPYNAFLSASRYAEQLEPYLEHFSRDQILVLSFSDLGPNLQSTMRRVFEFLGLDPSHRFDTAVKYNSGGDRFEYGRIGRRLRNSRAAFALRKMSPTGPSRLILGPGKRLFSKPLPRLTLDEESRQRLVDALAPDAKRFRDLTGLPFTDWSL